MPDGLVAWVDVAKGEAGIQRRSRRYVARVADIDPAARHIGARVHFDIRRDEGTEAAVDVRLRGGARTDRHHRRFGTLVGARRPDTKGTAPFGQPHPEYGLALAGHPLQVAGQWARRVAAGELDEAFALYAPDARLYLDGDSLRGRHVRTRLEALPVFGTGAPAAVNGEDGVVVTHWAPQTPKDQPLEARSRVQHGLITEQWIGPAGPGTSASGLPTATGEVTLATQTTGEVGADAVDYAQQRIGHVLKLLQGDPVLFARVKLSMAADPARTRPATAEAALDVNGRIVRAHVAAHEVHEAIDLLERRLADKVEHLAERTGALRRHKPGAPSAGEWRHGSVPTARPDSFDRPAGDRQLVRHKAFVPGDMPVEDAAFNMGQLDYDFYLFRDAANREDSVLARDGTGYRLQHLGPTVAASTSNELEVAVDPRPAPTITVERAIELLDGSGERFVFFASDRTGRGNVLYRRYDGHYGLITLE